MSEAEGGWADLLHESALEASSSQTSAKPASVPEPGVTLPQQTRYAVSPQKGSKAVTMVHFFGPVGSTASGAGKGLVTCIKKSYVQMEGTRCNCNILRRKTSKLSPVRKAVVMPQSSGHAPRIVAFQHRIHRL
mmetsp:Transcript_41603/g.61184  ORF Transcript_41603/g.61184 Transcript_41603/m.61184 type:complete len:133 (-) Transcript_41603:750-1148(-)